MTEDAKIDYFTESRSVDAVTGRVGQDADARLAHVMNRLVHHLHAFVKDVELTQDEWGKAIDFLNRFNLYPRTQPVTRTASHRDAAN